MDALKLEQLIRKVIRDELKQNHLQQNPRILRIAAVIEKTGLGKATIYEKERTGDFPSRFKIGGHKSSGWLASEIDSYILEKAQQREAPG